MSKGYDKDYFKDYSKKNLKRVSLNLSNTKDKDILQAIKTESPDNIQAGVKSLIRRAIKDTEDQFKGKTPDFDSGVKSSSLLSSAIML